LQEDQEEEEEQHEEGSDVYMDEAERAADARMGYTEQDEGGWTTQLCWLTRDHILVAASLCGE
jgi:hypothetical protein